MERLGPYLVEYLLLVVVFKQTYNAFCSRIYRTTFTISYDTNGQYSAGSVATIIFARFPLNTTCTLLSISALKYSPGMSTTTTALHYSAFIVAVRMTAYVKTVGDVSSFGSVFSRFFLPSATPHPFIDPSCFSFRNISRARDLCFCFYERFSVLTGWNASLL